MSDQPKNFDEAQHKSSLALDEEIARLTKENAAIPPAIIAMAHQNGQHFQSWVDNALQEAQEDKERFLGTRPPKPEPQPNVAISQWQAKWKTATMNNKRELGPGDVKK